MVEDINRYALPLMSNHLETLREFRQAIYASFPDRRDRDLLTLLLLWLAAGAALPTSR